MSKGKRYEEPKLNIKKVIAVIVAILVIIMFVFIIKGLFNGNATGKITSKSYFTSKLFCSTILLGDDSEKNSDLFYSLLSMLTASKSFFL